MRKCPRVATFLCPAVALFVRPERVCYSRQPAEVSNAMTAESGVLPNAPVRRRPEAEVDALFRVLAGSVRRRAIPAAGSLSLGGGEGDGVRLPGGTKV
jgi:hypothetical protein